MVALAAVSTSAIAGKIQRISVVLDFNYIYNSDNTYYVFGATKCQNHVNVINGIVLSSCMIHAVNNQIEATSIIWMG